MIKKIIKGVTRYIIDSDYRFLINASRGRYDNLTDPEFLQKKYYAIFHQELNLNNPKSFNEKLQWIKLHDRKDIYTTMVDKVKARDYVASIIGEEYLIPIIGVWDNPDEIDFESLPDQFVLKCNHNSGLGMIICKDKSSLNSREARNKLKKGLAQDYYLTAREWPYKNVKRKIIGEQYMGNNLTDYKFLCFEGKPQLIEIHRNRGSDSYTQDFYTMDWIKSEITQGKRYEGIIPKPKNFDLMVKFSKMLAADIRHIRVDWYEIRGKLFFGELTFFDGAGFEAFDKKEYDEYLGSLIKI